MCIYNYINIHTKLSGSHAIWHQIQSIVTQNIVPWGPLGGHFGGHLGFLTIDNWHNFLTKHHIKMNDTIFPCNIGMRNRLRWLFE